MTEYDNEFLKALRKPPRPGFNKLERDWYFHRFISDAAKNEALVKMTQDISKAINEPLETVGAWILEASAGDPQATGKLIRWLPAISKLEETQELSRQHSYRDMAGLLLCSRLPIDWVIKHRERLETEYLISFPDVDWDFLKSQKPCDWLKSDGRWEVVNAITDMMPGSMTREFYDYGRFELFDGDPPPPEEDEGAEGNEPPEPSPEPSNSSSDSLNTGTDYSETLATSV